MTLIYMNREEALDEFEEELLPRMKDATELRDLYSAEDTKRYVVEAVKWAAMGGSNTALDLFGFVSSSSKKIHVVGMKGGFQCFGTAEGKSKVPVVFIDLDGFLNFKTRLSKSQHSLRFSKLPKDEATTGLVDFHYKNIAKNSEHVAPQEFEGNLTELSNRIATLHELGHAKQWIENPNLFNRKITGMRGAIRDQAAKLAGPEAKHILKESDQSPLFTAWDPIVEMDNMSRHEWPICRELGIGYRKNYADLGGHTGGRGRQLDTLLKRRIEKREEEERAKKAQVQLAPGKCPYCSKTFKSDGFRRVHVMNEHRDKPSID